MNVPTYLLTTLPLVRLRRAAADNIVPHQALRTREDMKSTYFIHIIINDTAGNYLNEVLYHQRILFMISFIVQGGPAPVLESTHRFWNPTIIIQFRQQDH